jgi:hypothetical protein
MASGAGSSPTGRFVKPLVLIRSSDAGNCYNHVVITPVGSHSHSKQIVFMPIARQLLFCPPIGEGGKELVERSREECQRRSQAGHNHRRLPKCEVLLRLRLTC